MYITKWGKRYSIKENNYSYSFGFSIATNSVVVNISKLCKSNLSNYFFLEHVSHFEIPIWYFNYINKENAKVPVFFLGHIKKLNIKEMENVLSVKKNIFMKFQNMLRIESGL